MNAPARPRPAWRTVDGIVLLDKPEGFTSNQALQRVRRLYHARKAGHTGSLDPLATGVLPLCFGQATKVAGFLLEADKTYRARLALGRRTSTGDREGEVVERLPVPALGRPTVEQALERFRGLTEQVPPMYSALKREGEALYTLARRGIEVERAPRPVRIDAIALLELGAEHLEFEVTCSKGTFVRTLGEDLARALGTVGHLEALRRTSVGGAFAGASPHPLAELEALAGSEAALDALLLPVDAALEGYPAVTLGAGEVGRFRHGQTVGVAAVPATQVRLYAPDGAFLGIGESDAAGCSVRPVRLMSEGDAGTGASE